MDYRSFELNFEVNAIVYDDDLGRQLSEVFFENLNDAEKINAVKWINGAWHKQMFEKTAGLVSPLL